MEDPRKSVNGLPPPISTVSSPLCLPVGSNPTGAMLSGDIKVRMSTLTHAYRSKPLLIASPASAFGHRRGRIPPVLAVAVTGSPPPPPSPLLDPYARSARSHRMARGRRRLALYLDGSCRTHRTRYVNACTVDSLLATRVCRVAPAPATVAVSRQLPTTPPKPSAPRRAARPRDDEP